MAKARKKKPAPTRANPRRRLLVRCLDRLFDALEPLDFDDRRKLLRWACDEWSIDPIKI